MYIWVGCQLPQDFEKALRQRCRKENADLSLVETAFHLPQHISLKISFDAGDNWKAVLDWLKDWCKKQQPFAVKLKSPEQVPGVLWIPAEENETLRKLHQDLDQQLEARFGIPQHLFDKDFRFHSTLFLDAEDKLTAMYDRLKDLTFPENLRVNTFLLGISEDNAPGTHRIVGEISV